MALLARVVPGIAIVGIVLTSDPTPASAHSVAQVDLGLGMTRATQEMLTSRGTGIQLDDVLEYIVEFTPVDNGSLDGPGGYVTFYPPAGTQVVGASVVQPQGLGWIDVPVAPPGGIPGGAGTMWGPYAAPFDAGDPYDGGAWEEGTLPQYYGDTGIFYSTDARTAKYVETTYQDGADPDTTSLTAFNGYLIEPSACKKLRPFVGNPPDCRTHNEFDAANVSAWGGADDTGANVVGQPPHSTQANLGGDRGRTAYLAGSPVAGPQTFYEYDYTGTQGPWQRITYPGSTIGTGPPNDPAAPDYSYAATGLGVTLDESSPLPTTTTAVRWAVGGLLVGELKYVKVDLKILPTFDTSVCNPVDAEVFGGDAGLQNPGKDNAWRYHEPAPANGNTCLVIYKTGPAQAGQGDTVTFTINATNTSAIQLTNVVVSDILSPDMTFVSASPTEDSVAGDTVSWAPINLAPGETTSYDITVTVDQNGNLVNGAVATSDQAPPGKTGAQILVGDYAAISHTKSVNPLEAQPGDLVTYTVEVANDGDGDATGASFSDTLDANLVYEPGTTVIGGSASADPSGPDPLVWNLGTITAGTTTTLEFQARFAVTAPVDACYYNDYSVTWDEALYFGPQTLYGVNTAEVCIPAFDIGDRLWEDLNGNGIQDPSEPGIDGLAVTISSAGPDLVLGSLDDVVEDSTTTAGGGLYNLVAPGAGDYLVTFETPAGMTFAAPDLGGDDSVDSDANGLGQVVVSVTADDPTIDAGAFANGSIGDFVFNDVNADGIQDVGEPGIDGVTVTLLDSSLTPIATTTTSSGTYSFTDLPPGDYTVEFTAPTGLAFTTASSVPVSLSSGQNIDTVDAGLADFAPVIDIQKTGPTEAAIGDTITYTYTLTHDPVSDGSDIGSVVVSDAEADVTGIALISGDDGDGLLEAGETWVYTGSYVVKATDPDPFDTLATVNGIDLQGDPVTDTDGHPVDVTHGPALAIAKSGPTNANVGDIVTYTFTVTNDAVAGDGSAISNTAVSDDVAGPAAYTGGDTDTDGLLETGESWTFEATYTVLASDPTTLTNTGTVAGDDPDGDPVPPATDTHDTSIGGFAPAFDLVKSGPGSANVGDTVTYTFTVTNDAITGDGSAISNAAVSDDIAGPATYTGGDTDTDGLLEVGESWAFEATYTVLITDPTTLTNIGTVTGDDPDGDPVPPVTDTHDTTIGGFVPVVDIQKTGPATAAVGDTITYTYTVTHELTSDGSDIASVAVTDAEADVTGITLDSGDDGDGILELGETWVYTGSYVVKATDPDPMDTLATVNGVDLEGDPVTDTDGHPVTISYSPALAIVKSGPATANVGDTVTYTFTVTNDAVIGDGSAISNVAVSDDIAGSATYTGGDTDTDGLLEVGEAWTYEATYTVLVTDPATLTNIGTVTGDDPDGDPVPPVTDTHDTTIGGFVPVVDIQKTGPATAAVGDTITYTYTVTHDPSSDGSDISSVAVTDAEADVAGIMLDSGDDGDGILQASETWVYTGTYVVKATDPDPMDTLATVNGVDLEGDPVTDTDGHPVTISYSPALDIVKSGPANANVGDTITYTFTATNDAVAGDGSPISNVAVSDDITGPATYTAGDTDADGLLEVGESWTFEATYTLLATDPITLTNTGTVSGDNPDGDPVPPVTDTHDTILSGFVPVIDIQKTGPATAAVGDTITYTYTVTHDLTSDGSDIGSVVVTDAEADVTGITLDSGDDGDGILEAGETWVYSGSYVVKATDPDPFDTLATVNGLDLDSDPVADTDGHPVDVTHTPSLAIVKSGPASAIVGDTVTYTFTVDNDAVAGDGSAISNVAVSDDIAGPATYTGGDTDTDGLLEVGESWTFEASYTVLITDPAILTNIGTVTGDDPDGDPVPPVTDTHDTSIGGFVPVIDIQKTGPATANVGDTITYTYTVIHDLASDGSDIGSVVVTDAEPDVTGIALVAGDDGDGILEVGETWIYASTYVVKATDPNPIDTLATVNGVDLEGDPVTDTNGHPLAVSYAPVLDIVKSGPATASAGDTVTYTFTVTNDAVTGDGSPISNVAVSDDIAGSATYTGGDTDTDGLLETGESWTFEASYTVLVTDPITLTNIGTVTGDDPDGDPVPPVTDTHDTTVGGFVPVIDVQKTGPATADAGDTITYTYTVIHDLTSDGSDISSVVVTDAEADVTGITLDSGDDGDGILEAGETWIYTGTYVVKASDPDPFDTLATVNGVDREGDAVTDTNGHPVDVTHAPALDVVKSGPGSANVGDTVTYTFTVTNDPVAGDGSAISNAAVNDDIAGSATYTGGDTDTDGLLEVGESWTFEATYTVLITDPTTLTNIGTVSGDDPDGDPVPPVSDTHDTSIGGFVPVVDIQKTGPATANAGDTITYTYTVTHDLASDGSDISSVAVTDAELDVTGITLDSGDDGDGILQTGETWVYTGTYVVKATDPNPTDTLATVNGVDLDGDPVTDTDGHPVTISYAPALAIVKSGSATANVGDTVTYTFTVTNDAVTGDGSAISNVAVSDDIAGLASYTGGDTDTDGLLEVGESWTFEATYTILITDPATLTNIGTVTGDDPDGDPVPPVTDTHDTTVGGFVPVIDIQKTGPAAAAVGDTITYTYTVIHDAVSDGSDISSVAVTDAEPDVTGITLDSGDDGDGILQPGETWVYTGSYVVKATDPNPINTLATVNGVDLEGDPVTDTNGHPITISYAPALAISKSGPTNANVGDTVTYTFTVANQLVGGDGSPISNVTVNDDIAGPASYTAGDIDADGLLETGEVWTFEATYTILITDPITLTNTGTATGDDPDGDPVPPVTDTHDTTVGGFVPAIDIQKTGPASAGAGDTITYTYTVTHDAVSDGSEISSVVVADAEADVTGITLDSGDDGDGILEASETWIYTGTYVVKASDPDPFDTLATVNGVDREGDPVTDTNGHPIDVTHAPALDVVKSGPGSANVGDTVTYTFTVTNDPVAGDGSAISNAAVSDDIAGPALYTGGDTDTDGLLEVGESWAFEATYTILVTDPTTLTNTGTVTGDDPDGDPVPPATDTHDTSIGGFVPVIDLQKTGPATANAGDTITYTYTVTHDPASDGSDIGSVAVTDAEADVTGISLDSGDDGDGILQAGETWIYTGSYVVKATDPDPVNTLATVNGVDREGDPVTDTNGHPVTLSYIPALAIVKSGPANANIGDTVTYTFTATNDAVTGDGSAISNAAVNDDIAGPAIYTGGDADTDGLLEVGESWTFEATYTILVTDPTTLTNIGTVTGDDPDGDPVPPVTDTHDTTVGGFVPAIDVQKTGPATAAAGDTITYTYTVTHDAASDGSDISSVVVVDAEADVTGISLDSGDDGDGILQTGETWVYTGSYVVKATDPDPFDTLATVDAVDLDGDPLTDTDGHPVDVTHTPALDVVKSGPVSANVGDTVTYTFAVTNDAVAGDGSAISNVGVSDDVAGAAAYTGGDTDTDGLLELGESWTFEATYTILVTDPATLTNIGTVTGDDPDGDPVPPVTDTHDTTVGGFVPVVDIQKTGPATAAAGDTITYTYTVTHDPASDGSDISNVVVTDAEPDVTGIALVAGDDGDGILEVGETWLYASTYVVKATDPDPIDTLATVNGDDLDGDPVSDTDGHPVAVSYAPALAIVKSGAANANVGDLVTYTFTVTNDVVAGDGSPISNVAVADDIAGGATYTGGDADSDALLETGESWTFEASYTILATDPTTLTNTGTVAGDDPDGDPVPPASDTHATTVGGFAPVIDIQKTGPATAAVGDTITYTYTVTHDPTSDASDISSVAVTDAEADVTGITLDSGDDGNGILQAGETWVYTGTYVVKATDPDPIDTLATVNGVDSDGDPVTDSDGHPVDVTHAPALSIVKSGPVTANVGDTVTYTLTVTNDAVAGDGSAISNVAANDDVAGPATYISGDTDSDGLLEVGEAWVLEAAYMVLATDPVTLTNIATASGDDPDGDPVPPVADTHDTIVGGFAPAVDIVKSGPGSANIGDAVTYTFTVTNDALAGDGSAISNVAVNDDIAGAATYTSGDTDTDGLLEVGESWTFEATYTVLITDPATLTNIGTVTGDDPDGDPVPPVTDTHDTSIGGFVPVVDIQKTGPATANVGDTITYTYTVTHDPASDGSDISSVVVSDAEADVTGITLDSGDDADGVLEPGETWVYTGTYVVKATDPNPVATLAAVNGVDLEGDPVSDTNSHPVAVSYAPALALVKSGPVNANVGDTVTYTFTVTNDAVAGDGSAISNVAVSDDVAGAATYTSGDTDSDGLLESGESWTFVATYTILATDPITLTNIGTVAGDDPDGDPVPPVTDTHDTTVGGFAPALDIVKSGPATANVGDAVTFTFTVTNDAVAGDGSAISNVAVNDDIAGPATFTGGDADTDGLLEVGESWTFEATYTILVTDPITLTNVGTVTGDDPDGDPVPPVTDTHDTSIGGFVPVIDIQKTGPVSASVGDTITYTYTVTHDPASDGSDIGSVVVTDAEADVAGITLDSGDDGDGVLEAGETWIYTGVYVVKATDSNPIDTLATVNGVDLEGDPVTDTNGHPVVISYAPALAIVKAGPVNANVGDTVTYTFTVTNDAVTGDGSAISNAAVNDDIAGPATYTGGDTDTNGLLETGESWTFEATHTVLATDPNTLTNIATVTGDDPDGDPAPPVTDTHDTSIGGYDPAIMIVKDGPASANVGATVLYTYEVTNDTSAGDGSPINTVTVTDSIAGLGTFLGGDTNGNSLLEVGEVWLYEANYTIQPTDPDPLVSPVTTDGFDLDGDPVTDDDTHSLDVGFGPVMALVKSGPVTAAVGELVTYNFELINDGVAGDGSPISLVDLTDDVAGTAVLLSGDTDGDSVLEVGEAWLFEASYTIAANDPTPLINTATSTGTDPGGNPVSASDNHSTIVTHQPELDIVKSGPAAAAVGDTITYTYTVTHGTAGDGTDISSVSVSDADPDVAGITLVLGDTNADGVLQDGEIWLFEGTYVVTADDPNPIDTLGTAIGVDLDADPVGPVTDGHPVTVTYNPEIDIQKTGPATAAAGDTITYTYTVTHDPASDGSDVSNVIVVDADVDVVGITLVSGDTNGDGILQATETWIYTGSYTTTANDPAVVDTIGTVDGESRNGDPVTDSDNHPVVVDFAPAIDVLTDGPTQAHVGELVTYNYTVTNDTVAGDGSPISNVTVGDDVAGPATYLSGDANADGILQAGETWLFDANYTVLATDPDPLVNNGTSDGESVDGDPVTDVDPHSLDVLNPAITIDMTPATQQVVNGGTATYDVTVTNTGDTTLTDVTVTNGDSPNCDMVIGTMAPGDVVTYGCDQVITSDVTSTSVAVGDDPTGLVVTDSDMVNVDQIGPSIGASDAISGPVVNNGDGTYTLTYELVIFNSGDVQLDGVTMAQDLTTTFVGVNGFVVDSVTSADLSLNPGFDGSGDTAVLDGSDSLAPGNTGTVLVTVTVTPGTALGPHYDQVSVGGTPPVGPAAADLSDSGSDPDPGANNPAEPGDSGGSDDPVPVTFGESPSVGIATEVTSTVDNGDGTHTVTYTYTIENDGDVDLTNLQVVDNLAATFADADGFAVQSVSSPDHTVNPGFDGGADTDLLAGTDTLTAGSTTTIQVVVIVTPGDELGPYFEQALVEGTSPSGITVGDISNEGSDPDPGADGAANDSQPTMLSFAIDYDLELTKVLTSGPANNNATWTITVTNVGTSASPAFQVEDILPASLNVVSVTGGSFDCTNSGQNVLCAHAGLAASESVGIVIASTITAGPSTTIMNTATATALVSPAEANISNNANSATVSTPPPALPVTGSSTGVMVWLASLLILIGGIMVLAARRRREEPQS